MEEETYFFASTARNRNSLKRVALLHLFIFHPVFFLFLYGVFFFTSSSLYCSLRFLANTLTVIGQTERQVYVVCARVIVVSAGQTLFEAK